jgi:hypothetical protein
MSNGTTIQEANQFSLQSDTITVSYSSTSIAGVPQFTYRDLIREVSRSGDDIRREDTEIGTLVTIDVEAVPDAPTVPSVLFCRGSTWARVTSASSCRPSECAPPTLRRPFFRGRSLGKARHTRSSTCVALRSSSPSKA